MTDNNPKVIIVGQGYVGLPIAMRAVEVGYSVVGLEIDRWRIDSVNAGRSYVEDVSDSSLQSAIDTGRYVATADLSDIAGFDFAVITVPTPLRETVPDLSFIEDSAREIAPYVTRGSTVVLESTTYPGTTQELLVPILEKGSDLSAGVDFHVGYSPERIDPGNATYGFVTTPKVVSGIDETALKVITKFYGSLVDSTVPVSTPREAELTKLLENTFRHVNIALINELAMFAHDLGIDVWEAIDAAATKPFGFMKFTPGPGVGGHCLPVDPSYLSWQVRRTLGHSFRFVELANTVNEHMPDYVVQRLAAALNGEYKSVNGSVILLIGLSYKRNTGDARESPAVRVAEILSSQGAILRAVDPFVAKHQVPSGVTMVRLDEDMIATCDAIIVLTEHDGLDYEMIRTAPCVVLDTRRRLGGDRAAL